MSSYISERIAISATIDPDSLPIGVHNSDSVDMRQFERVLFVLAVGPLPLSSIVTLKLQQSDMPAGTFTDVEGKTVSLTEAAADDRAQALVEIRADELTDGQRYVRANVTINTDMPLFVLALGSDCRYRPAERLNLVSVKQIVR